jgi:2-polyprenyl-6-methoxyphenol hydroxylase-like FAD-dependent oxidoreductase
MREKLDIAVAGAGIGGLATAIFLARAGHTVHIFDQFDAPKPIGSGLMLQRTGLTVLEQLTLRADIDALGSKIDRLWGLVSQTGRPVLDVQYKKLSANLYGLGLQRSVLFDALLRKAKASGVTLSPSTKIVYASAQDGTLKVESGAMLGPFDLVIDALGVRSPLTRQPKKDLPYGALWTTLPWPEGGSFESTALEQRYEKSHKMAGVMASGRTRPGGPTSLTYFWSIRGDREAAWRAASLDEWKAEAEALWPDTRILLDQIDDHDQLTFAHYRHRTHPHPVSGAKLVHIGDAWHAASPQLGQGANMALLDAYALAKSLEDNAEMSDALKQYKRLRSFHVSIYQLMTWLFTPVYQGDSDVLPFLRDRLAAPLSRVWPAPKFLASMVSGAIGSPLKQLHLVAPA